MTALDPDIDGDSWRDFARDDLRGDWWREFFDDDYVALWDAKGSFHRSAQEAADVARLLSLRTGARVLDIPCGFGRHAGPLHRLGCEVVGMDVSEYQIARARRYNPGPRYVVGDMRNPPPGPFDAVLNLYTSFGYFEDPTDDRRALAAWHRALAAGGTLVMELSTRERLASLRSRAGGVRSGDLREHDEVDWAAGIARCVIRRGGVAKTMRFRLYSVTDIVGMFRDIGFDQVEVYGDLSGSPYRPPRRAVFRAEKNRDEEHDVENHRVASRPAS